MRVCIIYVIAVFWRRVVTAVINVYAWKTRIVCCRRRYFLVSLIGWLLFLFIVVVINFLSCMIIEMVHSRTEEALHYLWTRASFMFASLETHITCIVLLTLLSFEVRGVLSNFTETRVMSIGFAENAISWCRWSSIGRVLCTL